MPQPISPLMQDTTLPTSVVVPTDAGVAPIVDPIVVPPVDDNKPVVVIPDATPADVTPNDNIVLPEAIDVDGVIYKIDDKGNAVNDKGEVFKTKDEILAELSNATDDTPAEIDTIVNLTNIKILDETGNPIKYDASAEGIAKYVVDAYNQGGKDKGQEPVNNLLNTFPILKDLIPHLALHGNLDGFGKQVDYSTVEIDKTNTSLHKDIIVSERMLKGDSKEEAEYYYNLVEKDGKSYDRALLSKELLVKHNENIRISNEQQLRDREQAAIKEEATYWNNVKSKVVNGKLTVDNNEYFIPEVIKVNDGGVLKTYNREDFFNYMYQPNQYNINNKLVNMTRHQYDEYVNSNNRTDNHEILDAYKLFVKGDMTQFINKQVAINNTQNIKKMFTTKAAGTSSNKQTPTGAPVKINFPVTSR